MFPAVCALGGALLLTHNHTLGNVKEELLTEISHTAIALFAVFAGWTRWLELRGIAGAENYCRLGLADVPGVYRADFAELSRGLTC